jgi:hypothetical protein
MLICTRERWNWNLTKGKLTIFGVSCKVTIIIEYLCISRSIFGSIVTQLLTFHWQSPQLTLLTEDDGSFVFIQFLIPENQQYTNLTLYTEGTVLTLVNIYRLEFGICYA